MGEIQDWGDEPAKDGRDAQGSALTDPDAVPRGWRPAASTIRAIQGVSEHEVVGGLSAEAEPGQASSAEQEFDPLTLLEMDSMPLDTFFLLKFDDVYARLHSLQSRPDDHTGKKRWMKIRTLFEEGKEKYLKDHPGATQVEFTE